MATWLEVQRQPPNIGVIVIILTIIIIIIIVKSIINTIAKILTESGASVWRKKIKWLDCTAAVTGGGQPQQEDHITHQFDRKRVTANLDKYERVALYQSCCLALYQYKIIASLT